MDSQVQVIFFMAIGGMLGTISRFIISDTLNQSRSYPLGTLLVNVIGSLVLGILITLHNLEVVNYSWVIFFGVGFLGAFTTMSSFAIETILLGEQSLTKAVANFVVMMFFVLISAFIGRLGTLSVYAKLIS